MRFLLSHVVPGRGPPGRGCAVVLGIRPATVLGCSTHYAPKLTARNSLRGCSPGPELTGLPDRHILGQASQFAHERADMIPGIADALRCRHHQEAQVGRLVSVNVGMPKNVQWRDKTVYTGIWKTPVEGSVMVRRLNIDGDGQGDLAGHGGEQRAVMVYQTESYDFWKSYLGRDDLGPGCFGENFTVTGLADNHVCIGDRYRIGTAEFEVT